jgi:hypothetical protein
MRSSVPIESQVTEGGIAGGGTEDPTQRPLLVLLLPLLVLLLPLLVLLLPLLPPAP